MPQLFENSSRQQDLQNLLGALYSACLFLGASNAISVIPVVSVERIVFYREIAAGMYSALPYAFSQLAVEIIYVTTQNVVDALLIYSMIGFEWELGKFFLFFYFTWAALIIFTLYGMMVVALTRGQQDAAIVMSFFISVRNLFSGSLVARAEIPVWWRWYYWLSPAAWNLYALVTCKLVT